MDKKNNAKKGGRAAGGPQGRPAAHQIDPQNSLHAARQQISRLQEQVDSLSQQRNTLRAEKERLSQQQRKDQREISRLKKLLQDREEQFNADTSEANKVIERLESQVSCLKESLRFHVEQVQTIRHMNMEELECMAVQLEEEEDKVADLLLKEAEFSQREKALENKCSELEEKAKKELADLEQSWEMKFQEAEKQRQELVEKFQKDSADQEQSWAVKFQQVVKENRELEAKFQRELAEREQRWMTKEVQLKEEKVELEDLCLTIKQKRRGFFSRKSTEDRDTQLHKLKRKMLDKVKKEKVEKTDSTQKEKEHKVEKKGFFRWMQRKNKHDSNNMVEEDTAGCSAQAGPQ